MYFNFNKKVFAEQEDMAGVFVVWNLIGIFQG
jgi:hypothetical protein